MLKSEKCACVCRGQKSIQYILFIHSETLRQGLHTKPGAPNLARLETSWLQGSSCPYNPSDGIKGAHHHARSFFL